VVVPIGQGVGESVVPAVGVVCSRHCYHSARPSPSAPDQPGPQPCLPQKFRSRWRAELLGEAGWLKAPGMISTVRLVGGNSASTTSA
jgi:hypothetical protein